MANKNKAIQVSNPTNDAQIKTFLSQEPVFEEVSQVIDPPLEITRSMLRLLNMVDETVIVTDRKS
jgi:hypothetical protein